MVYEIQTRGRQWYLGKLSHVKIQAQNPSVSLPVPLMSHLVQVPRLKDTPTMHVRAQGLGDRHTLHNMGQRDVLSQCPQNACTLQQSKVTEGEM